MTIDIEKIQNALCRSFCTEVRVHTRKGGVLLVDTPFQFSDGDAYSIYLEPLATGGFRVTDTAQIVPVTYAGILPDLFKEGKGVVAQGTLGDDGVFRAKEVLAKHDENYMPPEAATAVERAQKAREMASKTLKQ